MALPEAQAQRGKGVHIPPKVEDNLHYLLEDYKAIRSDTRTRSLEGHLS